MAEDKKGFVLYADQKSIFEDLTNEEAGILIKYIFSYVNDENPAIEDRFIAMAFKLIKLQLKRDLVKYQAVKERNSANARKRWDAVASSGMPKVPNDTKNADKDTVTDTGNGTDTVKDINLISQYFLDFENGSHIVEMARTQKTTVEILKAYIPHFKIKANSEYPSYGKFVDHFRNLWLQNKDIKQPQTGSSIKLGRK